MKPGDTVFFERIQKITHTKAKWHEHLKMHSGRDFYFLIDEGIVEEQIEIEGEFMDENGEYYPDGDKELVWVVTGSDGLEYQPDKFFTEERKGEIRIESYPDML